MTSKISKNHIIRFIFEIIIIFIGLSLSFWVEELKQQNDRKDNIQETLSIIRNNIHQDTLAFDVELEYLNDHRMVEYYFLNNNVELTDSLYQLLYESLNYRCIVEKNQAGYEMLMNIQLPKNFFKNPLNIEIVDFYDSDYSSLATVVSTQNQKLTTSHHFITSFPIPTENTDFTNFDKKLFKRLIYLDYQAKSDIRIQYVLIMESARNILRNLEKQQVQEFRKSKT